MVRLAIGTGDGAGGSICLCDVWAACRQLLTLDWQFLSVSKCMRDRPFGTLGIERLHFLLAIACSTPRRSSIESAPGLFNQKPIQ